MLKYLYGKRQFLDSLAKGEAGIRLSDIAHYSIMENELMRDNELEKVFALDKDKVQFLVNGQALDPRDMTGHPVMRVTPYRCFCLCLSGRKNDAVLFERFKADICIEIDVDELVNLLTVAVSRLEGAAVVHREVSYYPAIMSSPPPDLESSLFYKRDVYEVENEYRIAITIPPHRHSFQTTDGKSFRIFSDDPKDVRHIFVKGTDPSINLNYITDVFYHASQSE